MDKVFATSFQFLEDALFCNFYNQDIKDDLLNIQNKYDEVNLLTKLTLVEEILKRLNSNADIKLILQKFILDWQNK